MAKSERKSKWRRKMRAVKRVKNSVKELARLNKTLAKAEVKMEDIEQIANVRETNSVQSAVTEVMQIDDGKKYNKKTMRDENGHYPVWMNQRAVKKLKKRLEISKKNKNKKNKRC